jgi:fatty acid desaturase
MKTIKYFILLLAISATFSSCFVRMHDRGHGRGGEVHRDGDRH